MGEMNVERWVEVFDAIGVDKEKRGQWHEEFEKRYPDGHQSFLEWLGVDPDRIRSIRERSRSA